MKVITPIGVATATIVTLLTTGACATTPPPVQLVETTPVETTLDNPNIPEAYQVWLDMLAGAKTSIDIAQFYVVSDGAHRMKPILEAIVDAAARGVRVRIIADKRFYKTYPANLDALKTNSGIDVRIFDVGKSMGGVLHAKYFVVDGRDAYLGSQNFDWRSLEHIQELGLRITEPTVVGSLSDIFDYDWELAAGGSPPPPKVQRSFPVTVKTAGGNLKLTAVHSPKDFLPDETQWDLPKLIALIDGAKHRVRVQLLSYETKFYSGKRFTELDDALKNAAARGVEVTILLSHWMTKKKKVPTLDDLAGTSGITVKIVTVPQVAAGFIPFGRVIHSKLLVVDDGACWVGTSNWSGDYFYKSRNVGLIVEGASFCAQVKGVFERTWTSPYAAEVVPGATYPKPRIAK